MSASEQTLPARQLPCIVCKKELECAIPHSFDQNQPYAATTFQSYGHYGSTVFDPMDGTFIEINVCDECLTAAGNAGHVLKGGTPRPRKRVAETWNPAE